MFLVQEDNYREATTITKRPIESWQRQISAKWSSQSDIFDSKYLRNMQRRAINCCHLSCQKNQKIGTVTGGETAISGALQLVTFQKFMGITVPRSRSHLISDVQFSHVLRTSVTRRMMYCRRCTLWSKAARIDFWAKIHRCKGMSNSQVNTYIK